jgi:hypothetical protein
MSFGSTVSEVARHLFAHLVRIIMPPGDPRLRQWARRLEEMKRCQTADELVRKFGAPAHKVSQGDLEIWHYPLGVVKGYLYSIHAATKGGALGQVYMHLEPTAEAEAVPERGARQRPSSGRSAKPKETGAYLGDPELYRQICAATDEQRRRAAAAVARWAVNRVGLKHPALDRALSHLRSGSPAGPAVASAVEKLVEDLDLEYENTGEQERAGASPHVSAFELARAASSVSFALSGDAAQAAYEAMFATDDRLKARAVVLEAMS